MVAPEVPVQVFRRLDVHILAELGPESLMMGLRARDAASITDSKIAPNCLPVHLAQSPSPPFVRVKAAAAAQLQIFHHKIMRQTKPLDVNANNIPTQQPVQRSSDETTQRCGQRV